MTRFLLNHDEIALDAARADATVLEYLRENRRKIGTKEGCASGDCGACTVVVAEADAAGEALRYRAVNSCIAFAGQLHGRQLISVEDLAENGVLHPVQRALVEHHASQCGFCTPGFVMSLFALYKNWHAESRADGDAREIAAAPRQVIENYLAGNLCRCTGYRPIIDAAAQATRAAAPDQFSRAEKPQARQLKRLRRRQPGASDFHLPQSARELACLLRDLPGARLVAGGTDLALEVTQELRQFDALISVSRVKELNRLRATARHLDIGAAVPLADCAGPLGAEHPALAALLRRFGSMQIRNQATVGGNLANASPVADLPPALLALGAEVKLQLGARIRRLAVEDFFTAYKQTALADGEFIRSVLLPRAMALGTLGTKATKPAAPAAKLYMYKISKRMDDDIAAVCAAFYVSVERGGNTVAGARAAFGGMAEIPKRALNCEKALRGRPLTAATLAVARRALLDDFQPISDARAGAAYRMTVAQNLLNRLFMELPGARPGATVQTQIDARNDARN